MCHNDLLTNIFDSCFEFRSNSDNFDHKGLLCIKSEIFIAAKVTS